MASALQPIGNVYSPYGAAYNTTPYAIAAYVNRAPGQGYSVDLPSRLNPETLPYPCESWRRIRVASVLRWIYRKIAAHLSKSISISPSPYYSPLSLLPLFLPPPPPLAKTRTTMATHGEGGMARATQSTGGTGRRPTAPPPSSRGVSSERLRQRSPNGLPSLRSIAAPRP